VEVAGEGVAFTGSIGDGAITLGPITVEGAGTISRTASGAITLGALQVAGTGSATKDVTGEGSITLGAIQVSGTNIVAPDKVGGDDRLHRGWDKRRAKLKLKREREFAEQIRDIYRELTGDPRTAERAEAILAPVLPPEPARGETDAARTEALEARAETLRRRADAMDAEAMQAEIALRILYRELRDWQEQDDWQAIESLLPEVL
jgi:hypothetical protein